MLRIQPPRHENLLPTCRDLNPDHIGVIRKVVVLDLEYLKIQVTHVERPRTEHAEDRE